MIAIDSIPPPSSLFSSLDPVVTLNTFFLRTDCWRAVQNPALVPQIFKIPSLILSTLASDSPTHLEILKIRGYFFPIKMKEILKTILFKSTLLFACLKKKVKITLFVIILENVNQWKNIFFHSFNCFVKKTLPLMAQSFFFVIIWSPLIVQIPD